MESDNDSGLEMRRSGVARRTDNGAMAIGQLDAARAIAQQLDQAGGGTDFVGVGFGDRVHEIHEVARRFALRVR